MDARSSFDREALVVKHPQSIFVGYIRWSAPQRHCGVLNHPSFLLCALSRRSQLSSEISPIEASDTEKEHLWLARPRHLSTKRDGLQKIEIVLKESYFLVQFFKHRI